MYLGAECEGELLALVAVLHPQADREGDPQQGEEDGEDGDHRHGHAERAPLLPVVLDEVVYDGVEGAARHAPHGLEVGHRLPGLLVCLSCWSRHQEL